MDRILVTAGSGFLGQPVMRLLCAHIPWNLRKLNGQVRRCLGTSQAEEYSGFDANTAFMHGLRETIVWYGRHRRLRGAT